MKYKKIFLFFVLLPLNVLALTKAPIDITKYDLNGISKLLDEGIITQEEFDKAKAKLLGL